MSEETKQVLIVSVAIGIVLMAIAYLILQGLLSSTKRDITCLEQGKSIVMGNCIKIAE